jgi:hypothetical protein
MISLAQAEDSIVFNSPEIKSNEVQILTETRRRHTWRCKTNILLSCIPTSESDWEDGSLLGCIRWKSGRTPRKIQYVRTCQSLSLALLHLATLGLPHLFRYYTRERSRRNYCCHDFILLDLGTLKQPKTLSQRSFTYLNTSQAMWPKIWSATIS